MNANDNMQLDKMLSDIMLNMDEVGIVTPGLLLQHSLQAWMKYAKAKGYTELAITSALTHEFVELTGRYDVLNLETVQ